MKKLNKIKFKEYFKMQAYNKFKKMTQYRKNSFNLN